MASLCSWDFQAVNMINSKKKKKMYTNKSFQLDTKKMKRSHKFPVKCIKDSFLFGLSLLSTWRRVKLHTGIFQNRYPGTSLVVQWLRIQLAMQGKWVWSLNQGTKIPYTAEQQSPPTTTIESACSGVHVSQQKILHAATKTCYSQISK